MTIAVAVSGGMDSLLALALLREAGQDVLALHAHFLPPDERQLRLAGALSGLCAGLGIPFAAVDLSRQFRERVIDPFVAAYASGLTPNPCAACNRDMKFGLLYDEAASLGAQRIATGHYARMGGIEDMAPGLCRGVDPAKDQSYFLALTPHESLARAVFPLGSWRKADVPAALAARNLAPPLPSESQEVCFIPDDDYRAFLEARTQRLPGQGPILLPDGREIGRHKGLWRYTIGQRKGIGIAWSEPLYVLDKLPGENALIVGLKSALDAAGCTVRGVNVLVEPASWPDTILAQTCYRQRPRPARAEFIPCLDEPANDLDESSRIRSGESNDPCQVRPEGPSLFLSFASPIPRPAPGQAAVLYDEAGRVLAGGIIA